MSGRPLALHAGNGLHFFFPHIASLQYNPGKQIYSPGETCTPIPQHFAPTPWPNVVPTINALASHAGVARERGTQIDNNSTAELPSNYLFLAGIIEKSQG